VSGDAQPVVRFDHLDASAFREVKSQLHGERRVSVWVRFLVRSPERTILHTRYDPGLVLERHGHASDHYIFVLVGSVCFGEERCGPGSLIDLPRGASFGPVVAGDAGAEILEVYFGASTPVPTNPQEYLDLLSNRGITRLPPPEGFEHDRVDT